MAKLRKSGLGKGLDALFVDNTHEEASGESLPISEIEPNKDQPRKVFHQEALADLAESIREHGVLQPILVRPMPGGGYQIVAGERRWRASRMAGLNEVPVIIRDMSDSESMEIALIENLQREDLDPIEEALGYRRLMDDFSMTQEDVAQKVKKSRPVIANAVRLLNLPHQVQEMLSSGSVSVGHARALLSIADDTEKCQLAMRIQMQGLSVREIEKMAQQQKTGKKTRKTGSEERTIWQDSYYKEVELALGDELARHVQVSYNGKKGSLVLEFYDKEDLGLLISKLSGREI